MELVNRMGMGVKTLEELAEIRGAMKMLRTIEGLPAHVHDTLEEFRIAETRLKEKEKNVQTRR